MRPAIRCLLALALLLLVSTAASAQEIEGKGLLSAKNEVAGELTIDGVVYRVTPETLIRDVDGNPIGLADVSIPSGEEGLLPISALPTARFRAIRSDEDRDLLSVDLLQGPE